jgi:hypothetical protein
MDEYNLIHQAIGSGAGSSAWAIAKDYLLERDGELLELFHYNSFHAPARLLEKMVTIFYRHVLDNDCSQLDDFLSRNLLPVRIEYVSHEVFIWFRIPTSLNFELIADKISAKLPAFYLRIVENEHITYGLYASEYRLLKFQIFDADFHS